MGRHTSGALEQSCESTHQGSQLHNSFSILIEFTALNNPFGFTKNNPLGFFGSQCLFGTAASQGSRSEYQAVTQANQQQNTT
jgi:hypothetical protein